MVAVPLKKRDPISPLRYPGGKALLSAYISGVIEEHFLSGCTFVEPYAGGASVSLELLRLGYVANAILVERDPLVYSFWWCVFNRTHELCAAIEATPVTLDTWDALQPLRQITSPRTRAYTRLQLGVAGLFFNRTNFSGIIGAGPIGGRKQNSSYRIDCRFNKVKLVKQIEEVAKLKDRVEVKYGDALAYLKTNSEMLATGFNFVYIDPPYYLQGKKLYRYHFDDEQHGALASYITRQAYPWLISYDDHPFIRTLYAENQIQPIYLDYKVKSSRTAQEIMISNLEIPPPVYEGDPSDVAVEGFSDQERGVEV